MLRRINTITVAILLLTFSLIAQELHRTGLKSEDITKSRYFKAYNPVSKISDLPVSVDLSQYMPPVGNQGKQGSCTAWSMGYYTKTYQEFLERGWDINDPAHRFSPAFIYNQVNGGVDSGASFSDAFGVLWQMGCALLSEQPYNENNYTVLSSGAAMENAINFRCNTGYWINTAIESGKKHLKSVLAEGKVATLGIYVLPNFDNIHNFQYVYCSNNKTGSSRGGHAITIVGYDDAMPTADGNGAFKFVNSWGTNWGDKGYGWISYKAISDPDLSQQAAVFITDKINYSPLLKLKIKIKHSSRADIAMAFNSNNTWIPPVSFELYPGLILPLPDGVMTFDLTDLYLLMQTGVQDTISVGYIDAVTNEYQGTIESLSIEDIAGSQVITSTEVPVTVQDQSLTFLKILFTPKVAVNSVRQYLPYDGETEVREEALFYWAEGGSNIFTLQVSTSDSKFEQHIVYTGTINGNYTSVPGLQRNSVYYWRVSNLNENNWSDIWSFKTRLLNTKIGFSPSAAAYNWIDISTTGTQITDWVNVDINGTLWTSAQKPAVMDDGYSASKIPIGFKFDFFGNEFDSLYVGINGLISFDQQTLNTASIGGYSDAPNYIGAFSNEFYPPYGSYYSNSIAIAYADLDLNKADGYGGGKILYQTINDQFILTYHNIGTFEAAGDTTNSFQMVLDKNEKSITLNYKKIGRPGTADVMIIGAQQNDTAGVIWYSGGTPESNRPGNNYSVKFTPIGMSDVQEDVVPESFALLQNYPNPFNPVTNIALDIASGSLVSLKIYNLLGQEVAVIVDDYMNPGRYKYQWNAEGMPSGIYLCKLKAGSRVTVNKMLLLK